MYTWVSFAFKRWSNLWLWIRGLSGVVYRVNSTDPRTEPGRTPQNMVVYGLDRPPVHNPSPRMKPIIFCSWDLSQHEKRMPPSPNWDGLLVWRHFQNGVSEISEIMFSPLTGVPCFEDEEWLVHELHPHS